MVFKLSKSKEGSKESASKESRSKEKASKESRSKEKISKESKSKEKASKSKEKISKSKESASKSKKSKETGSKEKGSKEVGGALFKPKAKGKKAPKIGDPKNQLNQTPDEKKKKLRFWLMIAVIIAIILALIIIGITLFFVLRNGDSEKSTTLKSTNYKNKTYSTVPPVKKLPPMLCKSDVCNAASYFLKSSSKFSVDPCTDFYEYVCGNYKGEATIAHDTGRAMTELKKTILSDFKLKSAAKDKIIQIQAICKKHRGSLIADVVNRDSGMGSLINDADIELTDIMIKFLKVTPDLGLFSLEVLTFIDSETKEERSLLGLSQSQLLKTREFILREQFNSMAKNLHHAVSGGNRDNFEKEFTRITNLMNDLKSFKIDKSAITEYQVFRHPEGRKINWRKIADALSPGLYRSLIDPVGMASFIESMIEKHSEAFFGLMLFSWFRNTVYSEITKIDACEDMLNDLFPGAIGFFYLHNNIDLRNNDEIIKMADILRESSIEVVMKSSWIDEWSKKTIAYKLKAMKHYIGYDDLYENIKELDKLYGNLKFRNTDSFFEMVQDVQKWEMKMMYEVISGERKEKRTMKMIDMNAFYMSVSNYLYITLGFMSPPFYHRELPVYFNYGGVGFAIGHEIGHSIGPENHQRDYTGFGKMNSNPIFSLKMRKMSNCLVEYYGERFNINGTLTLEENSADNIGLRSAIRAMKKETEMLKRDILMPGFETKTNEQMFFYSIAAGWCAKEKYHTADDEHAPSRARINGAFSLSEDFAKAFQCDFDKNSIIDKLPPVLCTSSICEEASMFLKRSSNFSVDPCTDFYEHVCGNYNGTTSLSKERLMRMADTMFGIIFDIFLFDILCFSYPLDDPKFVNHAKDKILQISNSCKENNGANIEHVVNGDIARLGWPILTHNVSHIDITDLLITMLKVTTDVGIFQLVNPPIFDAEMNRTRVITVIASSKLLGYSETDFRSKFLMIATSVHKAKYPKANKTDFNMEIDRAVNLYKDLKECKKRYASVRFGELRHPVNGKINWEKIAEALNPGFKKSLYDDFSIDAILEEMLAIHPKEAFLDLMYFSWFMKTAYSPLFHEDPCFKMMIDLFPGAIGYFILYTNIDLRNNDEIIKMTEILRESMIELVTETSWIDKITKKEIVRKLETMKHYIGYDDLYENVEELDKLYRTLEYSNTRNFFEMVQDVQKWEMKMMYEVISGDRKETYTYEMLGTNARYLGVANLLSVDLGKIIFPFYHHELPLYFNYGGIGSTVGHEIGHAIGPKNHMNDYSRIGKMMSDPVFALTMKNLTSCLVEYYSNRYNVNGKLTLEENSADVIGLKTTIRAIKKEIGILKQDVSLPGFEEKTNEQMFFYSVAASWCEHESHHLAHDVHASSRTRMNGMFSLNEDFAKAFQCKKGTNMNPVARCKYYGD